MIEEILYLVAALCLFATFFASWAARSLKDFSRSKLEELCRLRNRRELLGQILLRHEDIAFAMEAAAVLFALLATVSFISARWLPHLLNESPVPLTPLSLLTDSALCVVALLCARLWIPEAFARLWAEPLLVRTWWLWRALAAFGLPITAVGDLVNTIVHRLAGRTMTVPSATSIEEEIRTIVSEGHREGLLEEEAREMIEGVIELGDCDVSQIMTPRTEMISISVHLDWPAALQFVNQAGHTRIPAYDKTRDDIVGILFIKDMLPELAKEDLGKRKPIAEILRKPHFVPETKRVDDLLREFQLTRNHMAVVLDEYGGVCGLITIEDVLEEIVGEIVDEHDDILVEGIRLIDERHCEASARVHLDEINERLGTNLPEEEDFDTLGGFVFHELGRIPAKGESLLWHNLRITVVDVSRRRIERVRIEVLEQKDSPRDVKQASVE